MIEPARTPKELQEFYSLFKPGNLFLLHQRERAVLKSLRRAGVDAALPRRRPAVAMAERGELPRALGATHAKYRTPVPAIILTFAIAMALTLSGTFTYALTISTLARLVSYGATPRYCRSRLPLTMS